MTQQPTHTHREHGGKYAFIGELNGGNIYNSEMLVIYHDVDKNITSHAVESDWQQNWKAIERDALAAHAGMMTRLWFDMDDCEQDSDEQQALITQMFDVIRDHHNDPNASLARLEAKILREYADKLEADEAPDAEAGDMWDASQCADWMREQAEKAEGSQ